MAENVKDLAEILNECKSEEEVLAAISNCAGDNKEELNEADLSVVVGGMSDWQAIQIVAVAYWDLCVCKKKKTKYSNKQIFQALDKCDAIGAKVYGYSIDVIKWGIKNMWK